jgi:hypothetical protein
MKKVEDINLHQTGVFAMSATKAVLDDRVSIRQLARETGLRETLVRVWTEDGSLSSLRLTINGTIYVSRRELEALIDSKITPATANR